MEKDPIRALNCTFFSFPTRDSDVHVFVGLNAARFTYLTRGRPGNDFDSSCHINRILDLTVCETWPGN